MQQIIETFLRLLEMFQLITRTISLDIVQLSNTDYVLVNSLCHLIETSPKDEEISLLFVAILILKFIDLMSMVVFEAYRGGDHSAAHESRAAPWHIVCGQGTF